MAKVPFGALFKPRGRVKNQVMHLVCISISPALPHHFVQEVGVGGNGGLGEMTVIIQV